MRKTAAVLLLGLTVSATPSYASWGSLVEDVKKTGGELIKQTISADQTIDNETLINGLKEALELGSERAVDVISADGGFLNDSQIRVPMPNVLEKLAKPMRKFGLGEQVDQFEESINRAAERAAPQATTILVDTIKQMTIEDARKIYEGADDAATQYFREKAGPTIAELFKPEVNQALGEVGATRYYDDLAAQAAQLPLIGKEVNTDLTSHVTDAALDGLFTKLAAEEKLIRKNPAARTTELLKKLWN